MFATKKPLTLEDLEAAMNVPFARLYVPDSVTHTGRLRSILSRFASRDVAWGVGSCVADEWAQGDHVSSTYPRAVKWQPRSFSA
jgi:hypothetical protein